MAAPALHRSPAKSLPAFCLLLALALFPASVAAYKWPVLDKAELSDPKPKVDPEAGAEILLREVTLDHSSIHDSADTYYNRVKIYTQRGVEEYAKVDLPYDDKTNIRYIAARTIKPDGTIVELQPKDIFERVVVKSGNVRVKVKSFAPPALEPGCILEYTYTEIVDGPGVYMPMIFQSQTPTRKVHYKVKLLVLTYDVANQFTVRAMYFGCPKQSLEPDKNGWFHFEMTNLPAAKDEPFQPPEINTRSSMRLYYALRDDSKTPQEYWGKIAKKLDADLTKTAKPSKTVQTALAGIVAEGDDEQTKLRKIYDFCRTKIVNRYSDTSGFTDKQREKLKENDNAADVLKNGNGGHDDINNLFAALARAAGMDVHFVACNDRTEIYFNVTLTDVDYSLSDSFVAVRLGEKWQFFDPGSSYLPFGMLDWWNTDTWLLIGDKTGKSQPIANPGAPAEASQFRRKGRFTLTEDGTLEGNVTESYTGYNEISLKRVLDGKTPEEREAYLREVIQEYQKLAELTDIKIDNATSPTEPLKVSYHLRIPQYADRTGSRLFLQPACFRKGRPPWFESTTRRSAIIFNHRYTSEDDIQIELPPGFVLEEASAPGDLNLGDLGEYKTSLGVTRKTNLLLYKRTFKLNAVAFDKGLYESVKVAFEVIHERDSHTITLKEKDSSAAPAAAQNPPSSESSAASQPAAPAHAATTP